MSDDRAASPSASARPPHGRIRRTLTSIFDAIVVLLLALMLAVGAAIVLVQALGLLFASTAVVGIGGGPLTTVACVLAGLLGMLTLAQARLHGWSSSE